MTTLSSESLAALTRYFTSAGSLYADLPPNVGWLPWCEGNLLRYFWKQARAAVQRLVPPRAVELMDEEFAPGGLARQFERWDVSARREVYALCESTGCWWWIDADGNVLPHGVRSNATYLEDLARMREASTNAPD